MTRARCGLPGMEHSSALGCIEEYAALVDDLRERLTRAWADADEQWLGGYGQGYIAGLNHASTLRTEALRKFLANTVQP